MTRDEKVSPPRHLWFILYHPLHPLAWSDSRALEALLRCGMVLVRAAGEVRSSGHGERMQCTEQGTQADTEQTFLSSPYSASHTLHVYLSSGFQRCLYLREMGRGLGISIHIQLDNTLIYSGLYFTFTRMVKFTTGNCFSGFDLWDLAYFNYQLPITNWLLLTTFIFTISIHLNSNVKYGTLLE